MDARLAQIKLDLALNKLSSETYPDIECFHKREAINKAQLEWTRRQIHGSNLAKEGDEMSTMRVDDLQFLLTPKNLTLTDKGIYTQSEPLPENYGWWKSILIYGSKDNCSNELMLDVHSIEEANVNEWLSDWSKKPSFEFRQCFYTLADGSVRVYTNNEFTVSNVILTYYRLPRKFDIEDCIHFDGVKGSNLGIEFKDDVAEIIIDEAASILAGDLEHISAYQITSKRKEENN